MGASISLERRRKPSNATEAPTLGRYMGETGKRLTIRWHFQRLGESRYRVRVRLRVRACVPMRAPIRACAYTRVRVRVCGYAPFRICAFPNIARDMNIRVMIIMRTFPNIPPSARHNAPI